MSTAKPSVESPLLRGDDGLANKKKWRGILWFLLAFTAVAMARSHNEDTKLDRDPTSVSELGVVAADHELCFQIGALMLRKRERAVDAAVATALCVGVFHSILSGIGDGGFVLVRSTSTNQTHAFNKRELAPSAASKDMYKKNPQAKYLGALAMGVPGELAGLHAAWSMHGRLLWKDLLRPALELAKHGFEVSPYLGKYLAIYAKKIKEDPGLRNVYAPNGNLLQAGDKCYNVELGRTLDVVAEQEPQAFYNGTIGEKSVKNVRVAGGILTMKDLRDYKMKITNVTHVKVTGSTIYGMRPPSSGTLALSMLSKSLNLCTK